MLKLVLLAAIFIVGSNAYSTRIVNGTQASLGEFPYIVSIQIFGKHNCGGSIIDATHILTAAHCVDGFDDYEFYIQYGVVDLKEEINRVRVSHRKYHAGFSKSHGFFDIAILTLEESIVFDDNTQPAVLPEPWAPTPEDAPSILAGWGLTRTGGGSTTRFLQKVDLSIFTNDECEATYNREMKTNSDIQLCSGVPEGGKGQCSGDSGGPLYANGAQVGVVSWSLKPCGQKGLPGVYTKVSMYIEWINKHIQSTDQATTTTESSELVE